MEHYAGIDVSLELSSVCVVDATGRIVREAKVPSEPEALVGFLGQLGLPLTRVGLEAGPLSQWLHAGLTGAGLEAVLLETRQVKAALSAMIVKTDRKDARGIAQLLRMGWYRPVHRNRCLSATLKVPACRLRLSRQAQLSRLPVIVCFGVHQARSRPNCVGRTAPKCGTEGRDQLLPRDRQRREAGSARRARIVRRLDGDLHRGLTGRDV